MQQPKDLNKLGLWTVSEVLANILRVIVQKTRCTADGKRSWKTANGVIIEARRLMEKGQKVAGKKDKRKWRAGSASRHVGHVYFW